MKSISYPFPHRGLKKHHPLTIALHWGTVISVLIAVCAVLTREVVGDKFWRMVLMNTHSQLGLIILIGVVARLYVRQQHGMANHMGGMPWVLRFVAQAVHWVLYAALIALPLLGWASTNAHNVSLSFLGLVHLPALVDADSEMADLLSDYHALGAWALLGVIAMHAGAALFHHFIRRDTVLWAMLPEKTDALPVLSPGAQTRSGITD
jgi:cytochrome b561